ncbi:MAG: rRNA pseudouridine synthase [Muribaculaceae bacterium]|nr:rRNA pseudouridine synthase [Muribaculaceae bacterium]
MAAMSCAKHKRKIMEEKKPKRPRIGALPTTSENTENKDQYFQSRPYKGTERPEFGQRGFQPRPRTYQNSYSNSYQNREEGGFSRQARPAYQQRQNAYNRNYQNAGSSEEGYKRYNTDSESQTRSSENSYQQNQTEGGYQQTRTNTYGRQGGQQGGFNRQNNYNRQGNRQQGGYNRQGGQQGGYQNRQQGGYSRQGGQQGGYQNRQQGGYNRQGGQQGGFQKRQQGGFQKNQKPGMKFTPRPRQIDYIIDDIDPNEPIRLNKFMANSGICSRREADEKIAAGLVTVNDVVVTELGTKINRDDVVKCEDKVVTPERKCYVLLNKPKDCVTTSDDPNGRMTVLDVVKGACRERIYPVGRLDRNTTGVLLLTNDGELASKLTHPKFVKKKIYHVWTDKDISEEDMQRIADGIELEDGEIHADAISYANDTDRNQAGIEIHSGRNRIVRRIFEHLGYRVTKLDRVYFAGLTKKNLPRGRWRYLTQEEVNFLRMGSFE